MGASAPRKAVKSASPVQAADKPYKRDKSIILRWPPEDEDHGLVVRCRPGTVGLISEAMALGSRRGALVATDAEGDRARDSLCDLIAMLIRSWNLIDDITDMPIPVTPDHMREQEISFLLKILNGWLTGVMGVSGPLERTSDDGGTHKPAEELTLPQEPLPASQGS